MSEDLEYFEFVETLTDYFNFYDELALQVFNLDSENNFFLNQVKSVKFQTFNKKQEIFVMKSGIDFDDEAIRCSYLLRYSVLNSYCIFKHFQDAYNCSPNFFNQSKTLRICCFGGGAGAELYAVSKVISAFLRNEGHQYSIKLYFTVIDACNEWESWIISLVKKLRKCDKNVVDVKMRFIHADVTMEWEEDVLKAVQKADILTMVKFFSALNLSEADYKKRKNFYMLESVAREMKLNSWIFFLDFAGGRYYGKMEKKMKKYLCFEQFQLFLHQSYIIQKDQFDISSSSLSFMYVVMYANCATKVSSGSWLKCAPEFKVKQKTRKKVKKVPSASKTIESSVDETNVKEKSDCPKVCQKVKKIPSSSKIIKSFVDQTNIKVNEKEESDCFKVCHKVKKTPSSKTIKSSVDETSIEVKEKEAGDCFKIKKIPSASDTIKSSVVEKNIKGKRSR